MVTGQPSLLTDSSEEKSRQVSGLYTAHTDAASHYSLGVTTGKNDEGETIIEHSGMFPANDSNMQIVVSADGSSIAPQIFMEQKSWLAQSILNKEGEVPAQMLRDYYDSKLTAEERPQYATATPRVIRTYLTEQGRLPENFKTEIVDPIEAAFKGSMRGFLAEEYLTSEGVVDSTKLAADFETSEEIDRAVEPFLTKGRELAGSLLEKSERLLAAAPREVDHAEVVADEGSDAEEKAGDVALDQETKAALSNIADLLREGGAAAAVDGEESAAQSESFAQKHLKREDAAIVFKTEIQI